MNNMGNDPEFSAWFVDPGPCDRCGGEVQVVRSPDERPAEASFDPAMTARRSVVRCSNCGYTRERRRNDRPYMSAAVEQDQGDDSVRRYEPPTDETH